MLFTLSPLGYDWGMSFLSLGIQPVFFVCIFTFIIHMTESLAYSMRLAGVRTQQIAISMSFVSSTLLISRLSNMFQAPVLGAMVDISVLEGSEQALNQLESDFRLIILAAFFGVFIGSILTPTAVQVFQKAILKFKACGSLPQTLVSGLHPRSLVSLFKLFRFPSFSDLKTLSLKGVPKRFLILNVFVTALYAIGVLCSLLAGAYNPEFRATAINLSGIVNGMATIMFTLLVDPPGARVTDQAVAGERPENDVRSVVFFLQIGKMIGILVFAQLLLFPLARYIMVVTQLITRFFGG